jgi:RimJ/RimL family protein N-acetyltransferase
MQLRLLEEKDLETVRLLRNSERRWFFHDEEITPEQHRAWFAKLGEKATAFYVIEEDGEVVGTISLTDTGDGQELGNLVLAERHRGRGLMRRAVAELTGTPGSYFARVKPDNERSLRVFEQSGFVTESVVLRKVVP